ncbi:MAG: 4-hydroxy-tetrahydrodipicolinate reductase [Planctomycetes bacterium]|nr:4-hydroxy-tetrahydrodipicolinate reductase [Planctomycetota bacterium]
MIRLAIAGATGRMGRNLLELTSRDDRFRVSAALVLPGDPAVGSRVHVGDATLVYRDQLDLDGQITVGQPACDVLIDFTTADGTMAWLDICERRQIPLVIGATGHSEQQVARIQEAAHTTPIVMAGNFSAGIHAILSALGQIVRELGDAYDIEIVETHHRNKIDAPSGTALMLVEEIRAARGRGASGESSKTTTVEEGRVIFGRKGRVGVRSDSEIGVHAVRMGDTVGKHEIHLSGSGETVTLSHTAHSRDTFAAGALRAAAWLVSRRPGFYTMRDVMKETQRR